MGDTVGLVYLIAGASLLVAIVLPALLDRWAVSAPMVLVAVGIGLGRTPLVDGLAVDPVRHRALVEHVAGLAVLVALMGVGLALDRPLRLGRWASWRSWSSTWRMLGIAMPLSIAGVTLLGLATGLGLATALLLGAVLAPTDPVLASDVQVAGPQTDPQHPDQLDEPDELRFALTSEAGLNDGLAFPFVHAAVLLAGAGAAGVGGVDWVTWVGWYAVGKVVLGVAVGIAVGRGLARVAFRAQSRSLRVAERGEALTSLAALLTAYGLAELVGGYGFLGVFACAMTFRSAERSHDYHVALHEVTERLERLLTLLLLLVLGIALSRGLLDHLDRRGLVIGLGLILVVRPLAGLVALAGSGSRLDRPQRAAVAFFGVRGIGSVYYLAFALGAAPGLAADGLWSTVAFTVVASVVVHGALATPVMRWVGSERSAVP
ncbi:cation:proton antiporter domain-containing protein [Nocardioides nitrophenolicus]|uniref:cation:proton antiporter domain-containing protein n=1 Tax=Nocardioides nitrophenolicus TaxID=60489 RepID=UPI0019570049|nr:cation:proton antiporter [Nocardioides nitrophenolicus]MBM7516792.1 NhaP-type Na+/H+ or K+/H+ antiporter [Nocardioides nitrophenolicus]